MQLHIAVIFGSVRPQRLGIRLARFVTDEFRRRGQQATLIDPLEHRLPLLEKRYRDYPNGEAPPALEAVHRILDAADAFVAVSAEYNGSVPPALVNILDHYLPEFARKPSGVCTYSSGPLGGPLVAIPLRSLFTTLRSPPIGAPFRVGNIAQLLEADGSTDDKDIPRRFSAFADDLEWYARALKAARHAARDADGETSGAS